MFSDSGLVHRHTKVRGQRSDCRGKSSQFESFSPLQSDLLLTSDLLLLTLAINFSCTKVYRPDTKGPSGHASVTCLNQGKTLSQIDPTYLRVTSQLLRCSCAKNTSFVDDVGPIRHRQRLPDVMVRY